MIIVGNKKIRIVNPAQIVYLELTAGRKTAYVKGDTDGDEVHVKAISVREPWTVVIHTPIDKQYLNFKNFDLAVESAVSLCKHVEPRMDIEMFEKQLRSVYGQEKETKPE